MVSIFPANDCIMGDQGRIESFPQPLAPNEFTMAMAKSPETG
jgi:hypothetical protein